MKFWILLPIVCLIAMPFVAFAEDTDAAKLIADFTAQKAPVFDASRREDQAYVQSYIAERKTFDTARADFGKDFYAKFPTHARAMEFLKMRWQILTGNGQPDVVIAETDKMLADKPADALRNDLLFARAMATIMAGRDATKAEAAAAPAAVDAFIASAPKDPRGAQLLSQMSMLERDTEKRAKITKRIAEEYADTGAGKMAKGQLRQLEAVGKPFELSFTEAVSGKAISMADLKGKVVVLDFWATWCGPCVAEMPEMKKLYAEYKEKGVEFIGISLDQPGEGLDKLKEFVSKNEIPWPQYYQGNGWASEFSSAWGINSIPCVFVIDAEGKLYSTQARGQLKKLIPELLAKKGVAQG